MILNTEETKEFLWGLHLQIFTTMEIKLRNLKDFKRTKIHHININIFIQSFSKQKLEEWHRFTFLQIFFISDLAEDSWIRWSAFSFNTLLWLKEKKKNWPCTDMQPEKELREPPESVSITPASPQHTL